jgi:hypothetical protein
MILTLSAALETLRRQQPDAMWQVANQNPANAAQNYMLLGLMPEMQKPGYQAQINNLVIRSTMAGLAGMDSPYPTGGAMQLRTFLENTAKIANEVLLSEQAQREMQDMVRMMMFNNEPTQDYLLGSVLNFADKIIAQAHFDTFEWLRGQALATGTIDWTYNNKNLVVDYGIPAANKLAVAAARLPTTGARPSSGTTCRAPAASSAGTAACGLSAIQTRQTLSATTRSTRRWRLM